MQSFEAIEAQLAEYQRREFACRKAGDMQGMMTWNARVSGMRRLIEMMRADLAKQGRVA
jgi:hypothetical protein